MTNGIRVKVLTRLTMQSSMSATFKYERDFRRGAKTAEVCKPPVLILSSRRKHGSAIIVRPFFNTIGHKWTFRQFSPGVVAAATTALKVSNVAQKCVGSKFNMGSADRALETSLRSD